MDSEVKLVGLAWEAEGKPEKPAGPPKEYLK